MKQHDTGQKEARTANSTYKKLAVQWLNEALSFVSSFVVADSLVLRKSASSPSAKPLCGIVRPSVTNIAQQIKLNYGMENL